MISGDSIIGNNASATSSSVSFRVVANGTLSLSVPSNVNMNVTPTSSGTFNSTNINVVVGTNNPYGYNLTMSTAGNNNNLTRNTALSNSEYPVIESIDNNSGIGYTPSQFEDITNPSTANKWGYQLTASHLSTSGSNSNFFPVPNVSNAVQINHCNTITSTSNNTEDVLCNANNDTTTITLATKLDNSKPSGTYTTTLNFIATANVHTSLCNAGTICYNDNLAYSPSTMSDQTTNDAGSSITSGTESNKNVTLRASNFRRNGYGFAGWMTTPLPQDDTIYYGPNQTITGTAATTPVDGDGGLILYANWIEAEKDANGNPVYMQDWNGCSAMNVNEIVALTDHRDNNVYAVAKLPMGWDGTTYTESKCWMIENLRLDNSATINSINTNNPLSTFASLAGTTASWCTEQSSACYNQSKLSTINTTTINSSYIGAIGDGNDSSLSVYSYGNYYNWYSATAGNGAYEFNSNNTSTSGDICPANWQLPKGGGIPNPSSSAYGDNSANNDFYKLGKYLTQNATLSNNGENQSYYTNLSYTYRVYPNNFIYSGYWLDMEAYRRGQNGDYWSSTASDATSAYALGSGSSYVLPGTSGIDKYYGFTARCLIPE